MPSAVENGDGHAPVVLHGLGLSGRHDFLGCLKRNWRSVGRRWRWGWRLLSAGRRRCQHDGDDGGKCCLAVRLHNVLRSVSDIRAVLGRPLRTGEIKPTPVPTRAPSLRVTSAVVTLTK